MDTRDVLNQCRNAAAEIAAIEKMIDKLSDIGAPSSGGTARNDGIGGRTNDPAAARLQAVEGCIALLAEHREKLAELFVVLESLLAILSDGKARAVIRYYYGCCWTDQRIADELGTSREVVTRRRISAEKYICLRSQKVTESHK